MIPLRMRKVTPPVLAAVVALCAAAAGAQEARAQSAGSAQRGATLFKQRCATCHSLGGKKSAMGPDLAGVLDRRAASTSGYKFSPALQKSDMTWTRASLDRFLSGPTKVVRGTRMMTMVNNPADRADIIAYLATVR